MHMQQQSQQQRNAQNHKEDNTEYLTQLRTELGQLDQSLMQANRLVQEEIDRLIKGGDKAKPIEIHREIPQKLTAKVLIPVKEYPKVNFVGKLIGPQGATLKRLQHELGCRLAIYGRGSMRDKSKEEELRKEGGKYAHLNDDLHIYLECNAPIDQAYERIGHALGTIKPYFDPNYDDGNMPPRDPNADFNFNGGAPPGRGAPGGRGMGRGAPRGRGGPGGPGSIPAGLGGPPSLLGEPARGGTRGGRGMRGAGERRGAPAGGRGAAPIAQDRGYGVEEDYHYGASAQSASYETDSYGAGYEQETAYSRAPVARDPYARQAASDVQSFDYGHGAQGAERYDQQDAWGQEEAAYSRPPARGRGQADFRSRPYPTDRPARPPPRY